MPIMDGIDAVRLIVQDYPKANVIMITSHGQEDMVREAIKNGAKGYILKPITEEKLAQSITKLFGDLAPHTVENETIDETLDDDMLDYEILED
jgi:two-component system chemotaxis response regulator CheY